MGFKFKKQRRVKKTSERRERTKRSKSRKFPDSYLFGALRKIFSWSPARREALALASSGGSRFYCAQCPKAIRYPRKDVAVDHRIPVVSPEVGFVDWNTYIERLYCPVSNLQVLCRAHHLEKTRAEAKIRTATRKLKKENVQQ